MKGRKMVFIVCCACLLVACLVFFLARASGRRERTEPPMEEEDLLAYLAEQLPSGAEEGDAQNLFWDPASDLTPDPAESSQ